MSTPVGEPEKYAAGGELETLSAARGREAGRGVEPVVTELFEEMLEAGMETDRWKLRDRVTCEVAREGHDTVFTAGSRLERP